MDDEDSDGFESANAFMTAPKEAIAVGLTPRPMPLMVFSAMKL